MRSGAIALLRFLAARWRDVCGPPADGVAGVDDLDDALKLCRAVLNVCGTRLRQKLADGLSVRFGLGFKAEHLVRVVCEFLQQLVCRLFFAHVPIVVPLPPLFKIARHVAMRERYQIKI